MCFLSETTAPLASSFPGNASASARLINYWRASNRIRTGTTTPAADPLGRDTPSGTLYGFLQAAQAGNYSTSCAVSANLSRPASDSRAKILLRTEGRDRSRFHRRLEAHQQPTRGNAPGRRASDKQRVGTLIAGDVEAGSRLSSVLPMRAVRNLADFFRHPCQGFPNYTIRPQCTRWRLVFRMPWWALIFGSSLGMAGDPVAIPVAALLGWLAVQILRLPWYFWARYRQACRGQSMDFFYSPALAGAGVLIHGILVSYVRIPVLQTTPLPADRGSSGRDWLRLASVAGLASSDAEREAARRPFGTHGHRLTHDPGRARAEGRDRCSGYFFREGTLGFNLTTPLAGLGIGGIAIAFAAQKTLENLFGGVSILGDEVIRIGDTCRFGDRVGTVEDISLRSTRIRTPDRTELSSRTAHWPR